MTGLKKFFWINLSEIPRHVAPTVRRSTVSVIVFGEVPLFGFRQKLSAHKKTQALGPDFIPVPAPKSVEKSDSRPSWAGLELFADMSGKELALVEAALEHRPFANGETILREGDVGDSMFILESGMVRVEMANQEFLDAITGTYLVW